METSKLTAFQREYLWELSIPQVQLLALAEAIPEEAFGWRPAQDARAFSEILVHIGAGMMMLLYRAEVYTPEVMQFCGALEGEGLPLWVEMVHRSLAKEKSITAKADVVALLEQGFAVVEREFAGTGEDKLAALRNFGGENTTVSSNRRNWSPVANAIPPPFSSPMSRARSLTSLEASSRPRIPEAQAATYSPAPTPTR